MDSPECKNHRPNGNRIILAFGSNLGNREQNLNCALEYISCCSEIIKVSQWQKTAPLKSPTYNTSNHDYYLNFVVEIITNLNPYDFYTHIIVKIENRLGHSRLAKWLPRALDIDVVFAAKNDAASFENCTPISVTLEKENFFVPHLEYLNREFWQKMIEVDLNYVPKR